MVLGPCTPCWRDCCWCGGFLRLPALLNEAEVSVRQALASSVQRTRGRLVWLTGWLVLWIVVQTGLTAAVLGLTRVLAGWLLEGLGPSLAVAIGVTAAVLVIRQAFVVGLAMFGNITFAAR